MRKFLSAFASHPIRFLWSSNAVTRSAPHIRDANNVQRTWGYFVIASPDHPFLLYDPTGTLKGSYLEWRTQLGALSYMLSGLDASFVRLQVENPALYQQALDYLLAADVASPSGQVP